MKPAKIFITFCFLGLGSCTFSQDIHFSQFYMAPLTQNPALAGANHNLQVLLHYKDQWKSITTPYKTIAASLDMKLNRKEMKKGYWAGGINFYNDKSGDSKMQINQGSLNIAYHLPVSNYSTLGAGFMGGFVQRSINYSALQWGEQYDGTSYNAVLPSGESVSAESFTYADMGVGILWNYDNSTGTDKITDRHDLKATFGFSVFHPQQNKFSFYKTGETLYMKYVLHGNMLIGLKGNDLALVPGFVFYRQEKAQEIFAGSLIRYQLKQDSQNSGYKDGTAFSLGAFMRTKDAIALAMLFEYAQYAIGISYDVNTSNLKTASNGKGGIEVSLRFVSPNPFLRAKSTPRI